MGGAYHALLLQLALAGTGALLALFGSLALSEANRAADGSIVAARLRERLPGLATVAAATALWFAAAEAIEPHHEAASPIAIALILALASAILFRIARALIGALVTAAIAVARTSFAPRTPLWRRRTHAPVILRRTIWVRRLFARPPPIALCFRA
jgi:hypothetical protein